MEAKNIIEVSHGDKLYLFCPHCGKRLTVIPKSAVWNGYPDFCHHCGKPISRRDQEFHAFDDMVNGLKLSLEGFKTFIHCFAISSSEPNYPGKYVVRLMYFSRGINGSYFNKSNKVFVADSMQEAEKFLPTNLVPLNVKDERYPEIDRFYI